MVEYLLGKNIRLWAHFTDIDTGDDFDPTTVTLLLQKPNGTESSFVYPTGIVKDSVGHYSYVLSPATGETGDWVHRWKSTGSAAITTAEEEEFRVLPSLFVTP